jgi:hypothetical protein
MRILRARNQPGPRNSITRSHVLSGRIGHIRQRLTRRVLHAYRWVDYPTKVAHKEPQIPEREHEVDQVRHEKERATFEGGVSEENRVGVQTQRNRVLKGGRKGHADGGGSQGT